MHSVVHRIPVAQSRDELGVDSQIPNSLRLIKYNKGVTALEAIVKDRLAALKNSEKLADTENTGLEAAKAELLKRLD